MMREVRRPFRRIGVALVWVAAAMMPASCAKIWGIDDGLPYPDAAPQDGNVHADGPGTPSEDAADDSPVDDDVGPGDDATSPTDAGGGDAGDAALDGGDAGEHDSGHDSGGGAGDGCTQPTCPTGAQCGMVTGCGTSIECGVCSANDTCEGYSCVCTPHLACGGYCIDTCGNADSACCDSGIPTCAGSSQPCGGSVLCCTGTTPPLMCVSGECAPQYPDAGGPKDGGTTCAPCGSNPCCTGSCTVFADGGSVCN